MPNQVTWVYSPAGAPSFYQTDNWLFTLDGNAAYFISKGYVYPGGGGGPEYHISGGWLYTMKGKPAFHYNGISPPAR